MKKAIVLPVLAVFTFFFTSCDYTPRTQELKVIQGEDERTRSGYTRYKPSDPNTCKFDTSSNIINLEIPLTENKLKVKKVLNISSDEVNAILVFLSGNNGRMTKRQPITGLLKVELEINKIKGLDPVKLQDHGKLRIVVYHDDKLSKSELKKFKDCIVNSTGYDDTRLCEVNDDEASVDVEEINRPNEEDGDIINGS